MSSTGTVLGIPLSQQVEALFKEYKATQDPKVKEVALAILVKKFLNDPQVLAESLVKSLSMEERPKEFNTIKELLEKALFKLPQPKLDPVVKFDFKETTFSDLQKSVSDLFKNLEEFTKKVKDSVTDISGRILTLKESDPKYTDNKSSAQKTFEAYKTTYNSAVELLSDMKSKEDSIASLKERSLKVIEEFTKANNQRIASLETKFKTLAQEHQLLSEIVKLGGETTWSRKVGNPTFVKMPNPSQIADRYQKSNETTKSPETQYTTADFTKLFDEIHNYYNNVKFLSDKTDRHLEKVTGARKFLDKQDPEFKEKKETAEKYPEAYQPLHDECLDVFTKLQSLNKSLDDLKIHFTKTLDQESQDIKQRKSNLVELVKELEKQYKILDPKVNNNVVTQTKDMRTLTLTTVEKYTLEPKVEKKEETKV